METSDPSGRLTVEDLSDCRSESSHSETQLRAFHDYERIKELNLSIEKTKEDSGLEPKDFHLGLEVRPSLRFDEFTCEASRNLSMAHNKHKDFGYISSTLNDMNYQMDRSGENEESIDTSENLCRTKNPKDMLFNIREGRQKGTHGGLSLDRYGKDLNFAMEKDIKDFGMLKSYGLERMKEFNLSLDRMRDSHISNFALERLRGGGGGGGLLENTTILEANDFKNMQGPPRNQDLEAIALERMRRSQLLGTDLSVQNLSTQLPHAHAITQMQHSQQQQQQAKSFTIDAILGLRNNQREKRGQQQQYRKHQSPEGASKNNSPGSCSSGGGGGKLKRDPRSTMKQVDRQKAKCGSSQSWTPKYPTNADLASDAYWKYVHDKNQTVPLRRARSPTAEQMASYYTAKPHKNHSVGKPAYFPHIPTRSADAAHRIPEKYMTYNREKYYPPNATVVRRSRYEPETENDNDKEYGDEETDNLTEDVGEDATEEAEEDGEGLSEYADKECEDHEADDEIDEESDSSPLARRGHRVGPKEAALRAQQRWKSVDQQEDPRRYRGYDLRAPGQCHPSQARRYYSPPEHELQDPLTDEEIAATAGSPNNPRRSPTDYYNWQQSRSYIDQYPTAIPNRRARVKPEAEAPFDLEFGRVKKCSRCGYVPNKKTPLTNKHNCRFDERLRFYAKGSIGDEFQDENFRGPTMRHNTENPDYPSSAPCTMESRRSRDIKSPTYESPEHDRLVNKITNDQAQTSRRYARESCETPEKNKRFSHPTYGSSRLPSRY